MLVKIVMIIVRLFVLLTAFKHCAMTVTVSLRKDSLPVDLKLPLFIMYL